LGLKVEGIIPAMVTPMDKNQEIDEEGMKAVINYLIDAGVHGIFVSGSQGEACVLTDEEKKKIIKLTVDEVNGRVPVYAGTGAISTRDVINEQIRSGCRRRRGVHRYTVLHKSKSRRALLALPPYSGSR